MNISPTAAIRRFAAMTLRERGIIFMALLGLVLLLWDALLMRPLETRKRRLTAEMAAAETTFSRLADIAADNARDDPFGQALAQRAALHKSLAAMDAQLQSAAAGLITPARMVEALREVLERQHDLRLVSLQNLPATPLSPSNSPDIPPSGPYVHPLEIVVEGGYLELLRYLRAVEASPWRFYWKSLQIETLEYPLARARLRLNTLSMDLEWLRV